MRVVDAQRGDDRGLQSRTNRCRGSSNGNIVNVPADWHETHATTSFSWRISVKRSEIGKSGSGERARGNAIHTAHQLSDTPCPIFLHARHPRSLPHSPQHLLLCGRVCSHEMALAALAFATLVVTSSAQIAGVVRARLFRAQVAVQINPAELELWSQADINVALGAQVTVSSTYPCGNRVCGGGWALTDGDYLSSWHSQVYTGSDQWASVTLPAPATVARVRLYFRRDDCCADYDLGTSSNCTVRTEICFSARWHHLTCALVTTITSIGRRTPFPRRRP